MKSNNGEKNFTYRLKDIKERAYNCNESGLFYHALPTLSLSNRGRALEIKTANLYGSLKKAISNWGNWKGHNVLRMWKLINCLWLENLYKKKVLDIDCLNGVVINGI